LTINAGRSLVLYQPVQVVTPIANAKTECATSLLDFLLLQVTDRKYRHTVNTPLPFDWPALVYDPQAADLQRGER
jgi:hypothetical protein